MVESLVAVTVVTIAGAALLTSVGGAVRGADDAQHVAVARGLAEQLIDEIAAMRFRASGVTTPSDPTDRSAFDDIDDYDGYSEAPPCDRKGRPIGAEGYTVSNVYFDRPVHLQVDSDYMNRFTRSVQVERVEPSGTSDWSGATADTDFRRVTVTVEYTDFNDTRVEVARVTRIFTNVDTAS
jgi:type II secretory pathway pseudopilin PulG